MNSLVLCIQLDALRHDYVTRDSAPFLSGLAEAGACAVLQPTFGFEPDFAYLAGLYPDEADGGAQFIYRPETTPFRTARFIPSWCDRLPRIPNKVLRRFMQSNARRYARSPFVSPAMIPFAELPKFDLAMRSELDSPGIWKSPSIFDHLRRCGRKWVSHWSPRWAVNATAARQRAESDLHPPVAFAFLHIGDLDRAGHAHGPESQELKTALRHVDAELKAICRLVAERFSEIHIVIFGDHGMAAVRKTIDVNAALNRLPLTRGRDYEIFLDSTMVRCWCASSEARERVESALAALKGGHLLGAAERDRYHLHYRDSRFGDIIYIAEAGSLILPNYYQGSRRIEGMHGYLPEELEQQAGLIIHSSRVKKGRFGETIEMRRLFPTLLDLLGIDSRHAAGGASLAMKDAVA